MSATAGEKGTAWPGRWVLIAAIAWLVYLWPRLIIRWLGEDSPWASYLYQYGMGLVVFGLGIFIILRSGACRPGRGRDSRWLGVLFGGFLFFAVMHALWIVAALALPYLGEIK